MMDIQGLNTDTYTISIDNTSKAATLNKLYPNGSKAILVNSSDKEVFVTAGTAGTAGTAVFPTSASSPLVGKVVLPGSVVTYDIPDNTKFISAIQLVAGTGNLYISIGRGL